jgi:hypothetical protein
MRPHERNEAHLVVLEAPEGERSFECNADEFIWDAAARNGIVLTEPKAYFRAVLD